MTVFECHNYIKEKCKQRFICDQYARMKAEQLKEMLTE